MIKFKLFIIKPNLVALYLQKFLLLEERNTVETPAQLSILKASPLPENVVIKFEDYSASWNKDNMVCVIAFYG